ncbi:hypothetical protein ACFX13_003420 [Malus domestica]
MDPDHEDRFDFDPLDDTKTWPEDLLPLQPVGRLVLNKNIDNFFAGNEQLAFNPALVVPGIYYSNDKMLQTRLFAYSDTQRHRLGPNYLQLPVDAPKCAHHNNHYDGSMNFMHRDEEVDYFPSRFDPVRHAETFPIPSNIFTGKCEKCVIEKENNFKQPGVQTPVIVRFSTVIHERGSPETIRDPRGFAVKFYTREGNWDLVGNNFPLFFVRDAMKFPDVIHAFKPNPKYHIQEYWRVLDFLSHHPESLLTFAFLFDDVGVPQDYRHMEGFGVHAYTLISKAGKVHYVTFHWKPTCGVKCLLERPPRFLRPRKDPASRQWASFHAASIANSNEQQPRRQLLLLPPLVRINIRAALDELQVLTADEARLSSELMGTGECSINPFEDISIMNGAFCFYADCCHGPSTLSVHYLLHHPGCPCLASAQFEGLGFEVLL